MDKGFRAQHTLVLEGTQITEVSWHLSQTDAFSGYILVEFVSSTLKMSSCFSFFQQSKQFHANSKNVSYVVSLQKMLGAKEKLCSTVGNYCTFQLPGKVKKVYLTAVNAAGKSTPTEVQIRLPKGRRGTDTLV